MVDTTTEESESKQEEGVDFANLKSLNHAYHELLFNSSILSKDYSKTNIPRKGVELWF